VTASNKSLRRTRLSAGRRSWSLDGGGEAAAISSSHHLPAGWNNDA
jgi:hypothetical protein